MLTSFKNPTGVLHHGWQPMSLLSFQLAPFIELESFSCCMLLLRVAVELEGVSTAPTHNAVGAHPCTTSTTHSISPHAVCAQRPAPAARGL